MKVYCAGPLFTPYEREYMSKCGQALRAVGIDPFVPHESFKLQLPPDTIERLTRFGVVTPEMLEEFSLDEVVWQLLQKRVITREMLGLPGGTSAQQVFDKDFGAIAESHAMLAVINGPEVDDGTACEIGVFGALMETDPTKKGIVAVHEDWRTLNSPGEGKGLNPFIHGCLVRSGHIVHSLEEAVSILASWRNGKGADA